MSRTVWFTVVLAIFNVHGIQVKPPFTAKPHIRLTLGRPVNVRCAQPGGFGSKSRSKLKDRDSGFLSLLENNAQIVGSYSTFALAVAGFFGKVLQTDFKVDALRDEVKAQSMELGKLSDAIATQHTEFITAMATQNDKLITAMATQNDKLSAAMATQNDKLNDKFDIVAGVEIFVLAVVVTAVGMMLLQAIKDGKR